MPTPTFELEPPLDPCRSYSFLYPGNDSLEPRRLFVTRIHDVNDGRQSQVNWLVTGTDLQHQVEVSYRFDAMQDVVPIVGFHRGY